MAEPQYGCNAVITRGQKYLANGDPGYPDEYCPAGAVPGSDYCTEHEGYEDGEDEGDDPDDAYDAWRESRMDIEW